MLKCGHFILVVDGGCSFPTFALCAQSGFRPSESERRNSWLEHLIAPTLSLTLEVGVPTELKASVGMVQKEIWHIFIF